MMTRTDHNRVLVAMLTLAGLFASGCVHSRPMNGRMNDYWRLHVDVWPEASSEPLALGDRSIPTKWVFVNPGDGAAPVNGVREAFETLRKGDAGSVIEVGISPCQWLVVADALHDAAEWIEQLRRIAPRERSGEANMWADTVADAIMSSERYLQMLIDESGTDGLNESPRSESSARALASMVVDMLDETSAGTLFGDMSPGERKNLRFVISQAMLRLAFASAGKTPPGQLAGEVIELVETTSDDRALRRRLRQTLLDALPQAPPAPQGDPISQIVRGSLRVMPVAMRVIEDLLRQWDRVEYSEFEYRRWNDQRIVSVTVKTKPQMVLKLKRLHFMQPDMTLRGHVRATIIPDSPTEQSLTILIEPLDDMSGANMAMSGVVWGLVRLMAIPVASGDLRQITVWSSGDNTIRTGLNVTLTMLADDARDPRRVMSVSHARNRGLKRRLGDVGYLVLLRQVDFAYLTPRTIYHYSRQWTDDDPER